MLCSKYLQVIEQVGRGWILGNAQLSVNPSNSTASNNSHVPLMDQITPVEGASDSTKPSGVAPKLKTD
jgi:hypothetical protein